MKKQERDYDEGFSDGVILALQMMAADGDGGGTGYVELLKTAGEGKIVARAKSQRMLRISGLSSYMREKRSNA